MLINFIAWIFITWAAICFGIIGLYLWHRLNREEFSLPSLDLVILSGLGFLTAYAQAYSFLGGVGKIANIILLVICLLFSITCRKHLLSCCKRWLPLSKRGYAVSFFLLILWLFVGSCTPTNYDTYLYHAQAIRWIEEYGVVPGLGHLHSRLAFNNSIFSLQALFGYGWLTGIELHSVNAYFAFIISVWAICSVACRKNFDYSVADALKFVACAHIALSRLIFDIGSPGSDFMPMGYAVYILAKWLEAEENGHSIAMQRTWLCLLLVFAATVKISVASLLILGLFQGCSLIREKRYRLIAIAFLFSAVISVPFMARGVMISGYPLYPTYILDVFSPDWKFEADTPRIEQRVIIDWARQVRFAKKYNLPRDEWFSIWLRELNKKNKLLFLITLGCLPITLFKIAKNMVSSYDGRGSATLSTIYISEIIGFSTWLFSAPDVRFGVIFILLLPCTLMGEYLQKSGFGSNIIKRFPIIILLATVSILGICIWKISRGTLPAIPNNISLAIVYPKPYSNVATGTYILDGHTFYYPVYDRVDYDAFPAIYLRRYWSNRKIMLRGNDIASGFCLKKNISSK